MTTECSEIVGQICERMRAVNSENERLREVSKEYIHALAVIRAENDRYRNALIDITEYAVVHKSFIPSQRDLHIFWRNQFLSAREDALRALANRSLSDDSGPIAEASK